MWWEGERGRGVVGRKRGRFLYLHFRLLDKQLDHSVQQKKSPAVS